MPVPAMSLAKRTELFWSRVDRSAGPNGCWPWLAGRHPEGYGAMGWPRPDNERVQTTKAHRIAFWLTHGRVPDIKKGRLIRHACGEASCCNPSHLVEGTHAENAADMVRHGRAGRGARAYGRSPRAQLTDVAVRAIKVAQEGGVADYRIAKAIGVSVTTVWEIRHGKNYADVDLL